MAKSYQEFLSRLDIPVAGGTAPFREVAKDWQWKEADVLSDIVLGAVTDKHCDYRGAFLCKPRGADKTSSLARLMLWAMALKVAPFRAYVAAADRDQASILLDGCRMVLRLNPWLAKRVKVQRYMLVGAGGSRCTIMSSDVASSWGLTPAVLVFDELSVWSQPKHKQFFDSLWSSLTKNPKSACIIATNAGYVNTWQWELWQSLQKEKGWYLSQSLPTETWLSEEDIKRFSVGMSDIERRRVFNNEWVEAQEGSVKLDWLLECRSVPVSTCDSCVAHSIGVDFGKTTSIIVLGVGTDGIVRMEHGIAGINWSVQRCMDTIKSVASRFSNVTVVVDQFQLSLAAEILRREGMDIVDVHITQQWYKQVMGILMELRGRVCTYNCCAVLDDGDNKDFAWELSQFAWYPDKPGVKVEGARDRISSFLLALHGASSKVPLVRTLDVLPSYGSLVSLAERERDADPLKWRGHSLREKSYDRPYHRFGQ